MVKLTEIWCTSKYQEEPISKILEEYSLREVCVNPQHIIMLKEDDTLNKKHVVSKLRHDLHEKISFTKLTFCTKHSFTVVGNIDIIMSKLIFGDKE